MAVPLSTIFYVMMLLICGSLNTITMKIAFNMSGTNAEGQEEEFQKPWFITFMMFAAMSLALPFDRDMWRRSPPVMDASPGGRNAPLLDGKPKMTWSKKVKMVAIPAIFDILATGLCSIGFLYIPASVWQLLRGAEMVFAAIMAVVCLGRKLYVFHWLGIVLCTAGIILVGMATLGGHQAKGQGQDGVGPGPLLIGMGITLAGQLVQAAQVIAEEWLLNDVDLPAFQIVGFEGIWGGLIMLFMVFPLLWYIPGADHGHLEDEWDAVAMISSSQPLYTLLAIYTFSCASYNMAGIAVTGALSAVHRVMLEAFRTSVVWVFGLAVHYCISPTAKIGEAWTPYSWLEVAGFVVLIAGQVIYGALVKIPGLEYPEEEDEMMMMKSPASIRNFVSPLPPHRSPVPVTAA
mmetsp:Transcript_11659/g.25507  ORF Transcript_11659/g.25507 Transcript_11659/m.25507 type:complete len:404 (+) Transcript_11659:81-1292(+)